MDFLEIKQSELKEITRFLIEQRIILHPKISPEGIPDFTGYIGKNFIVFLDRNLLVRIIRLISNGELKDSHSSKLISCLLLWADFNNISLNSGLALMEYSYHHDGNTESSKGNNIFLEMYKQYSPQQWLDLALNKRTKIPKIDIKKNIAFDFHIENDHFKLHYLEMLKLSQLYFDTMPIIDKYQNFLEWVYDNIMICKYTTYFAALFFGNKIKLFKEASLESPRVCRRLNSLRELVYEYTNPIHPRGERTSCSFGFTNRA